MSDTQRRLIVLRHAKSDWKTGAQTDHERPLNERGRKAAPAVAERLRALGWVPQVVVSSDATRTRQTWDRMQASLGGEPSVTFDRALYLAGPSEVKAALNALPAEVTTVMVIGHNPGWEDVIVDLSGVRVRMTTCNAALLKVEAASWSEAATRSNWAFEQVVRPKEL